MPNTVAPFCFFAAFYGLIMSFALSLLRKTLHSSSPIESIAKGKALHPVQKTIINYLGLQCGFCTSVMIIAAIDILNRHVNPNEEIMPKELSGSFFRCTGYQKIVEAILPVSKTRSSHPF